MRSGWSQACTTAYLQNQMAATLGGRVAEETVYGEDEVTTGASNDLQQLLQQHAR